MLNKVIQAVISSGIPYTVPGADPSFADVALLLHLNGVNNGISIIDSSINNRIYGSPPAGFRTSTDQIKFGSTSGKASGDNTSSRLSYSDGASFLNGTNDFCIETWVYITSYAPFHIIFNSGNTSTTGFYFGIYPSGGDAGKLYVQRPGTDFYSSSVVPLNEWVHVAMARVSNVTRLFINGDNDGIDNADSQNYTSIIYELFTVSTSSTRYYDDFRHTIGQGRYTTDFTVPDAQFPDF